MNVTENGPSIKHQSLEFLAIHSELFEQYISALDSFNQDKRNTVYLVDSLVRGVDRDAISFLEALEKNINFIAKDNIAKYESDSHKIELVIFTIFVFSLLILLYRLFDIAKISTRGFYSHNVTGLYNKDALYLFFEYVIKKSDAITLYLADIDNFKAINEVRGIVGTDDLLKEFAITLPEDKNIIPYHVASNFFVFIPQTFTATTEKTELELQQYFEKFKKHLQVREANISFTTCVCTFGIGILSADDLFNRCSAAMQEAKECGKGLKYNYKFLRKRIEERQSLMRIASSIEVRIQNKGLLLYGQAIVDNKQPFEISHYEVLIRCENNGKHQSPQLLLQAAEKYDKSLHIDMYVIEQVFKVLSACDKGLNYSINLSAKSLRHTSFQKYLIYKVTTNSDLARLITFELTETAIVENLAIVQKLFVQLRQLGCRIAIDDFGVGESSFIYLLELSVDVVKIDGVFIKRLISSSKAYRLVSSIVALCKSLGIETVAEFVENEETLTMVREMGINHVQGYFIHKPSVLSECTLNSFDTIDCI